MKRVRTVSGFKRIDDNDRNVTALQLRDILNEQRKVLINRLLSDIQVYIDYRFNVKADTKQLDFIKEKLDSLKNHSVDMNRYGNLLERVLANENAYIGTAPFYQEIDESIITYLKDIPLKLVK